MNPLACWQGIDESLARHLSLEERLRCADRGDLRARADLAISIAEAKARGELNRVAGLCAFQRDVREGKIAF